MLQIVGITTNFSKLVPKAPNSGGNAGGHFFHEAKNESCQKQKQLMPNDRSRAREEKNTKRSCKKNQALGIHSTKTLEIFRGLNITIYE